MPGPRRSPETQLKIDLGHRPTTRWSTIQVNPKGLTKYVSPTTLSSPAKVKRIVRRLAGMTPLELAQVRRSTQAAQRTARQNAVAEERTKRATARNERLFIAGQRDSADYTFGSEEEMLSMLGRYLPRLQDGERFVLIFGDLPTYYTLSLEKYEDLVHTLNSWLVVDLVEHLGSDAAVVGSVVNGGSLKVVRPQARNGAKWTRWMGEFFPYTHDFECAELQATLARLGCWKHVDASNYKTNCLWNAFQSAGVAVHILEAMKIEFLQRKIARKKLKVLAEEHRLRVTIHTDGCKNVDRYGPEEGFPVELAIIQHHYIHLYKTPFNSYAVKHYDEWKRKKAWWTIKDADGRRDAKRGMSTLDLLRCILDTPHVRPIDLATEGIFRTQFYDRVSSTEISTLQYEERYSQLFHPPRPASSEPYVDEDCEPDKSPEQKAIAASRCLIAQKPDGAALLARLDEKIKELKFDLAEQASLLRRSVPANAYVFFDFEASPFDVHSAFCCRYSELNETTIHEALGEDCAHQFLDDLAARYGRTKRKNEVDYKPPVVKLLAHNITYDLSFLLPECKRLNLVEQITSVICGCGYYFDEHHRGIKVEFQDTYKMISMPLAKFGTAFQLDQEKEVLPYKLYTKTFLASGGVATREQLKCVPDFAVKTLPTLYANAERWGCEQPDGRIDMIRYASRYCEMDVHVLKEGWKVFRNSLLQEYNMDAFSYPTISSLADAYFIEQGCFEGVHHLAGIPRQFIANCSTGGRVMCANNQKVRTKHRLADFDGVSLYPSSMARIPGYLQGAPKVWRPDVDLHAADGYFLKIRVHSVGRKWRFPIARLKDESGGNLWTNDLEGHEIYVDRFTLEDLVRHSQITYTILQGYYFDEGRNPKVNEVIVKMFQDRLRYKKEGNPMQLVIKLMMNSAYGKCGLKPITTDVKYIADDERVNFIQNHFNEIKQFTEMPNGEWRFELYKQIDTHYNRQHAACEILSVSKNIMNEVMCLAEELGATIYYTDTDSMHIDFNAVCRLGDAFRLKYGRELIGKGLGQFHTDFDFDGAQGEIWAEESIFLGKKTYIDRLRDEAGNAAYHIRMKGIPEKCIHAKVMESYEGDAMGLFDELLRGATIEFDLQSGGNCVFKTGKDHLISTGSMKRRVHFV